MTGTGGATMERYFKIVEIDRETFINATDEDLGSYTQSVIPTAEATYVGVSEDFEDEIQVPLASFRRV